ncbi:alcohol oxidase [Rhizodiscina lignyota]|uniref:Alcohol oxidase n=1 Tax=Rhizodiscina lignyota TaxID=1504668 RepID=A0A9P4IPZ5_9PEZI|nr:alcohol oxidase [Rhizodiscina lignyota]
MESYDFIIVGAGCSGAVVAARLAETPAKPSVLLLEAGGPNDSTEYMNADARFTIAFSPNSPLNWGYKTAPQTHLAGQQIDYSRGKGLGGSTAINFCGWLTGPRDDYDEWARLVQDESFNWLNAKRNLDKIVKLHPELPVLSMTKYIHPDIRDHSTSGKVDITYNREWMPDIDKVYTAAEQIGWRINPDVNNGDPIGLGMGTTCIYKGQRLTSTSTYLPTPPPNLTIGTNAFVAKILLDGKRATGIITTDGRKFQARKEVIISAGALNTPQILLLSGIGPSEELNKHGIPVFHELPMVGKNLMDHCTSQMAIARKRDLSTQYHKPPQAPSPMGFFKLPRALASEEYQALPLAAKQFLQAPTEPNVEVCTRNAHTPPSFIDIAPDENETWIGALCFLDNPQSRGTVTLQSTDLTEKPIIDPQFLTHPFDRRVMIEGIRELRKLLKAPVYAQDTLRFYGPEGDSDEEIWEHVRNNVGSSWHMSCTAKMGVSSDDACVDSDFRVFGLEALRIIDMSVTPFVPSNHTQSTAYVIGEIASEKLIKEYEFDSSAEIGSRL